MQLTEEAKVRTVSEAYDLTYCDEDTDWVIFKEEDEARLEHYVDLV